MAKHGKKYQEIVKKHTTTAMPIEQAVKEVKKSSYSKFVGTMELHVAINVPKEKDAKSIKGSIALPYPIAKSIKIAVITTPEKFDEAKKAGADLVGLDEIIKDVKAGKIDFDILVATPDVMPKIAILGKELGPKGLMPNPKNGTVATDLTGTISEYKKGKMTFACDESGVMHFVVGKADMEDQKIIDNVNACIAKTAEIVAKPANQAIKTAHISVSMGLANKIIVE